MLLTTLQLAWRELRANLLRSLLTTLGIIVGVAAVVIVVTLGEGISLRVTGELENFGRNLLYVSPFKPQRRGPGSYQSPFELDDADAIRNEVQGVRAVAPITQRQTQIVNGSNQWQSSVTGTTSDYLVAGNWEIAQGRGFSQTDERGGRPVCILGDRPRLELFGAQPAVGATVRVGTTACEVIGVLRSKGQSIVGQDQDDIVLMPILAVQRRITGTESVNFMMVSAASAEQVRSVQEDIGTLMRERRKIRDGDEDNFSVENMQSVMSLVETITGVLTAALSAVAGISLLVGGIGIMNIMLVSVTERTREIGIRLAIGALERDVLAQFLVEAVLLSCLGGLLGAALGLGSSAIIANLVEVPFVFSPWVVVVAFGFSSLVGIVFGIFPARRAAALDPIEALRYE